MERRKIIIYSIFAVVSVYGFYFHFLSGETSKKRESTTTSNGYIIAGGTVEEKAMIMANPVEKNQDPQPVTQHNRRRDPFRNNNFSQGISRSADVPVQHNRPTITAISKDGPNSIVVANDKVIKIGEKIGSWRLVKAESERALFEGPDGAVWVYLGG